MNEILERANKFAEKTPAYVSVRRSAIRTGYVQGASEQCEIDIDKACEWIHELLVAVFGSDTERIDKEIFSFRRYMKGELL